MNINTSIEKPFVDELLFDTFKDALSRVNLSRQKKYATQLDVSYADEMSDNELRRFVSGKSFLITGTENEVKRMIERLQGLNISYS